MGLAPSSRAAFGVRVWCSADGRVRPRGLPARIIDCARAVCVQLCPGASAQSFRTATPERWRRIEARVSRYCSGLMNLSFLYVPIIAAGYALAHDVRKVSRRWAAPPRRRRSAAALSLLLLSVEAAAALPG